MEPKEILFEKEELAMKEQLEKMVDSYDSYMSRVTFGRENKLREQTLNRAGVKPGDCVLEVGSGTGTLALAAKKKVGSAGKVHGTVLTPGTGKIRGCRVLLEKKNVSF